MGDGDHAEWNSTSLFDVQLRQADVELELASDSLSLVHRLTDDLTGQVRKYEQINVEQVNQSNVR